MEKEFLKFFTDKMYLNFLTNRQGLCIENRLLVQNLVLPILINALELYDFSYNTVIYLHSIKINILFQIF